MTNQIEFSRNKTMRLARKFIGMHRDSINAIDRHPARLTSIDLAAINCFEACVSLVEHMALLERSFAEMAARVQAKGKRVRELEQTLEFVWDDIAEINEGLSVRTINWIERVRAPAPKEEE